MQENCLLELRNISKSFGGVKAVQNIDLRVYYNEILAVVGDNGAGKSTLVKVISGAILADGGRIFLEGKEVFIKNPLDALNLGIQMLYQNLELVECLGVTSNMFLGREICKRIIGIINVLDLKKMKKACRGHLNTLGIDLNNVDERVKNLSGGQRQAVAISRAVYWGTKLVILDEPTAALGVKESKRVNDLIKNLKNQGISIIVISHNLQNVFDIANRIVVLRHGKKVGERIIKETNGEEIVKMITGA